MKFGIVEPGFSSKNRVPLFCLSMKIPNFTSCFNSLWKQFEIVEPGFHLKTECLYLDLSLSSGSALMLPCEIVVPGFNYKTECLYFALSQKIYGYSFGAAVDGIVVPGFQFEIRVPLFCCQLACLQTTDACTMK